VATSGVTDAELAAVRVAFWRYERALMSDDVAELDRCFLPGPATLRADAAAVLVGSDAIAAFRAGRGGAPARIVDRVHLAGVAPGVVVAVAETRRRDGARGLQSQTWVTTPDGWRVAAAHVSVEPAGAGPVWRLRGTPLVPGAGAGPLRGVGVAVKDLFAVAGYRTGAGNPTWLQEAAVQERSAGAVQALLDAGADVVGIAQTDELAYSLAGANPHYGTPPNPRVPGHLPGGSSSGPASAVALGEADAGLGTDTAGSIRVPASYLGLLGLRPSHGTVDAQGLVPLAPRFDTVGVLARDAATLLRVADVLLPPAPPEGLAPPRTVLLPADLFAIADADVAADCRAAALSLAAAKGLDAVEVDALASDDLEEWFAAFRTVQAAQAHDAHGAWVLAHPGALGAAVAERFALAAALTPTERADTVRTLDAAVATLRGRVPAGAVVAFPATSSSAPPLGQSAQEEAQVRGATLRLTCLASLGGLPALVLPARARDPDPDPDPGPGLAASAPVGLCLLGSRHSDRTLLALA